MEGPNYLKFSINGLIITGLSSASNPIHRFLSTFLVFPLMNLLPCYLIFYQFFDGDETVDPLIKVLSTFEAFTIVSQVIVRKIMLLLNVHLLESVLSDCKHKFYAYDATKNEQQESEFNAIIKSTQRFFHSLIFSSVIVSVIFCVVPYFKSTLPFPCHIPNFPYAVVVVYALEVSAFLEGLMMLVALDGPFLLISADMLIQFRIFRHKLRTLNFGDAKASQSELKSVIQHHGDLLVVHKRFSRFFSIYFLVDYCLCTSVICIELFAISAHSGDIVNSIMYIADVVVRISLFFLVASYISDEAELFQRCIYEVEWYEGADNQNRRDLNLMLMRSQTPLEMTGANFFSVNRNQLLSVFKLSYSISTFLHNVKG